MAWKYISLLNEIIKILLTIAFGGVMGQFRVFKADVFVPHAVKFVFYVCLPLLVVRGIGIVTDFYKDDFLWAYIGIFLVLRAIALVAAFVWVFVQPKDRQHGIGEVAVIWLTLTWISTVILGIPIAKAVFGNAQKGQFYGLLAGISSFIFQLPLQLCFLECHTLEQEYYESKKNNSKSDVEALEESAPEEVEDDVDDDVDDDDRSSPLVLWLQFARRRDVWTKVGSKVLRNPILWGIGCGFVLSLSTLGPTYLMPPKPGKPNPDYIEGLGFVFSFLGWLADCVTPVSLFAMGLWMQEQGKKMFQVNPSGALLFMISKLVIVPLVILGLAKWVNLEDEPGRAAVLIASLPISMASFSLGSKYDIGHSVLSSNVCLGTLLMLPTVIIWNIVMDELDIFPIAAANPK